MANHGYEKIVTTTYQSWDGHIFKTEKEVRQHLSGGLHECPQCKTKGYTLGNPIRGTREQTDEEAGYNGWFAGRRSIECIIGHEHVRCNLCGGLGWTKEEKKPIIKEEIIGWE